MQSQILGHIALSWVNQGAVQKAYHSPEMGGGCSRQCEDGIFYLILNCKNYYKWGENGGGVVAASVRMDISI